MAIPPPLNLGNQANEEIIILVNNAFRVSFDEGLMEDPTTKSPFNYNRIPVVSQADDSDFGEILSTVLNVFRDAAGVRFRFIADELAERLNHTMFNLFKEKFVTRPGKFSPFYLENTAIFPKQQDAGNLNKFIDDTKILYLFNLRGY